MTSLLKYVSVYLSSGFKFILGPILGVSSGLSLSATVALTALGMMTTIYLLTFFGKGIRKYVTKFRKSKKVFTKKNRTFVRIWRKYGLEGICLLTPLLLTPPIGGLLANVLETNKSKLLKWMWISALAWSLILTLIVKHAFWLIEKWIYI